MSQRVIVFDTETTGLHASVEKIIEYAFAQIDNNGDVTENQLHSLVNPKKPIPKELTEKVHGITDEMVFKEQPFSQHAQKIFAFITDGNYSKNDNIFIAHNADFDVQFINTEMRNSGIPQFENFDMRDYCTIVDTCALSRKTFATGRHSLNALCERFEIDLSARQLHGAMIDCQLLAKAYVALNNHREQKKQVAKIEESAFYETESKGCPTVIDINPQMRELHEKTMATLSEAQKLLASLKM